MLDPNGTPAAPLCCECGLPASLATGQTIYPHREDLWGRSIWLCDCGAYVGCHAGTDRPLGRPAGKETRDARSDAHQAFDRLWLAKMKRDNLSKTKARGAGYLWLAEQLDIDPEDCHIGSMTATYARRVVDLCRRRR